VKSTKLASRESVRSFWPLADDFETEIFDSLAWNLPGYRKPGKGSARYLSRGFSPRSAARTQAN
jgi:hypothetical protein